MKGRDWWRRQGRSMMPELRQVVMEKWDPIGICDEPACAEKYDDYLPKIAKLLYERKLDVLTAFLDHVRTEEMGIPPDRERDERAAAELGAWYGQRSG